MDDRFKFRFWRKNHNGDLIPEYPDFMSVDGTALPYDNSEGGAYNIYDDAIVEQCTGLKDKNGKLIYEGDILSLYKLKKPIVVICKWNIDKWVFVDTSGCIRNDYSMEIIGNIHKNPELLEQNDE